MEKSAALKGSRLAFTRRAALAGAGASAVLGALDASAMSQRSRANAAFGSRPNIIFILADDLGYADLSVFGRRDYKTPNIDRLAQGGIRFTHAYSNSPVCSATRTALMSGQYQYRLPVGLEEPLAGRDVGYDAGRMSMPMAFQQAGYQTALVGKWHLGSLPGYSPLKSGYDHFWGIKPGGVDYFRHTFLGAPDLWDGDSNVEETGYITDLLGRHAIDMVERFAENEAPFFLSLHFTAPHWPWMGRDDQAESERLADSPNPLSLLHYDGGDLATYAKMVTALDENVGQLLERLEALGIADNTIVVFTSDNGGERFSDTWPFTGRKTELLEGGIRVPTLLRWPNGGFGMRDCATPVMTMDWFPTLLSMAGIKAPDGYAFDGMDFSATLAGEEETERALFFRFNVFDQSAVRKGKWKYLSIAGNEFLFDIVADPLERANLKQRYPAVFESLKSAWHSWNEDMLPYDEAALSGGHNGTTTPDRYGITPSESVKGNAPVPVPQSSRP